MSRRAQSGAAVIVAAAALAAPPLASAHAILVRSDPADGARLTSSPQEVRLRFNEPISPRFSSARLVGPNGRSVPGARVAVVDRTSLVVAAPRLRRGTYFVDWHVLSEDDGHTTSGTLAFGLASTALPLPAATHEPLPSVADTVLRWLRFSLLALLVGGIAFAVAVLGTARHELVDPARRRVLAAAAIAGALATAVGLAALLREVVALSSTVGEGRLSAGVARELLFSSRWGRVWFAQEAAGVALIALAIVCKRRGRSAPAAAAAALLAVAAAIAEALGSHAAARTQNGLAVGADAVHVLAAAVWIGGVAALVVALWPVRGASRRELTGLAVACRRPFALLACGSAVVVVATGLYSAGVEVASVDALLTTFYGRTVLAKALLVGLVGLVGAANFLLLRRAGGDSPSSVNRLVILAEAALGASVLAAAAVLTASAPALGPAFGAQRAVHAGKATAQQRDLLVVVEVRPNRPGNNVFTVIAASSRRPPPAPIRSVGVELGPQKGEGVVPLRKVAAGRYVGTGRLVRPGAAELAVVVGRDGETLRSPVSWSVERPDPARPVRVSSRRLSTIVNPAVFLLLAAAGLAGVLAFQARRRPGTAHPTTIRQGSS